MRIKMSADYTRCSGCGTRTESNELKHKDGFSYCKKCIKAFEKMKMFEDKNNDK